jgi:hypothetical protein
LCVKTVAEAPKGKDSVREIKFLLQHFGGQSPMVTLLGYLVFAAFLLAQIAAVVVIHAARTSRGLDALEATRLDPRARAIWKSGG